MLGQGQAVQADTLLLTSVHSEDGNKRTVDASGGMAVRLSKIRDTDVREPAKPRYDRSSASRHTKPCSGRLASEVHNTRFAIRSGNPPVRQVWTRHLAYMQMVATQRCSNRGRHPDPCVRSRLETRLLQKL